MSKAWSRDMVVDSHTFGGTKACEVLADLINKNIISIYEKHRTLSFLNRASCMYHSVDQIHNQHDRCAILNLMHKDLLSKINCMPYPDKFLSYMRNVITHYYRTATEKIV